MNTKEELIAAALRLTALAERNSDDGDEWQHAINSVREACARAMVQPAAPDMAEVERLVGEYGKQSWFDGRVERIDGGVFTRETRTALLDYVRGVLAERDQFRDAAKTALGGWPCEIIKSDFEHNTVTLKMNHYGYIVCAGPHYLVPAGWRCTRANGHEGPCAAVEDKT